VTNPFTPTDPNSLRYRLRADAYRYSGSISKRDFRKSYLHYPGLRFSYHLRMVAHYAEHKKSLGLLPYAFHRFWLHRYKFRFGFDISPNTRIGPGFFLGHFGGIVVSPQAVLGSNVNLAQGVTIGATSRGPDQGAPTLGDRVWVGASAILVGKIRIGDDALIAPGAYVNFDVPAHAVVIGNPGKVVSHKGSAGYINNVLEVL
jgi:serine O-acetyltransferase